MITSAEQSISRMKYNKDEESVGRTLVTEKISRLEDGHLQVLW